MNIVFERAKAIRNYAFPIEAYTSMCPDGFEDITPKPSEKISAMGDERLYDKIIEEVEQYDHWGLK